MKVAIAGAGYTGVRLAQLCRRQGLDVFAMTRSPGQQAKLAALGVSCELLDLDAVPAPALPVAALAGWSVVYMVPPPDSGATDLRMARFLAALAAQSGPPDNLVYLSTSAVYGDCHGRSADETTATRPASDRGRRRLDAEQQVLDWGQSHDVPVRILRVPGIYGPGRLPLARLAAGATVARDNGNPRPGNRIHVDDLCGACLAALTYTGDHQVFNVGDGNHASMGEYFRRVAALAGLPPTTGRRFRWKTVGGSSPTYGRCNSAATRRPPMFRPTRWNACGAASRHRRLRRAATDGEKPGVSSKWPQRHIHRSTKRRSRRVRPRRSVR